MFRPDNFRKYSKDQLIKYQQLLLFKMNSTRDENKNTSLEEYSKRIKEYDEFTEWFSKWDN